MNNDDSDIILYKSDNGKLKIKRHPFKNKYSSCTMSPPDKKNGTFPFVLYVMGGVYTNLIVGFLFWICYFLWPDISFVSPVL